MDKKIKYLNSMRLFLEVKNPYPNDIFHELSKKEIKEYINAIEEKKLCVDAFSAHLMRDGYNVCINTLKKEISEMSQHNDRVASNE